MKTIKRQKKKGSWYLYVLECEGNTLYTGISTDPQRRFKQHQEGRGAAYARIHKPLSLRYWDVAGTHSQALKMEARFKALSRSEKLAFLASKGAR